MNLNQTVGELLTEMQAAAEESKAIAGEQFGYFNCELTCCTGGTPAFRMWSNSMGESVEAETVAQCIDKIRKIGNPRAARISKLKAELAELEKQKP